MSNSRPKSKLVTYSRAKRKLLDDDDLSIKRRRVVVVDIHSDSSDEDETSVEESVLASSPPAECLASDAGIFSDHDAPALTPPSSPSPLSPACGGHNVLGAEIPALKAQRVDAFAMLRRQPLNKPKKRPLVQMQLNLGQSFQKKCRTCGMEFVPSNPEDAALHRKFHSRNVDGVTVSKDFIKKAEGWGGVEWHGKDGEDRIISISRHWRCQSGRQYIMPVLDVVQAELGAVDIPYNLLWSLCYTRLPCPARTGAKDPEIRVETVHGPCYERYKVFLYLRGTKCVGLCLAERINKAHKVLEPPQPMPSSKQTEEDTRIRPATQEQASPKADDEAPIVVSETANDVWMGVSRIWVSSSFRKQGVATALLDCASRTFREKRTTPKELIAFSQTTQSGARLARQWFGKEYGWHVYTDCNVTMESEKGDWYSRREDETCK